MKQVYRQLLGFMTVAAVSLSLFSFAAITTAERNTYDQVYARLSGYADGLANMAAQNIDQAGDGELSNDFLNHLTVVLFSDQISVRVFDHQGRQTYPTAGYGSKLPAKMRKQLATGQRIHIKNDHDHSPVKLLKSDAYTTVLTAMSNDQGKLIGFVMIGSAVRNSEDQINDIKQNLLLADIVTVIIAAILSSILAFYNTSKIRHLSKATKKVADGDLSVQVPVKEHSRDELNDLSHDFNRMVNSLKQSTDEVVEQEQRRDQFMADIAHEMRTPLTTINGILEGLEYDAIPQDSIPQSLGLMHQESKRLIRLVNETLDYERIRSNQIPLNKTTFNAAQVLADLQTQMTPNAEKAGDRIIVNCTQDVTVYADHDRFMQIMVNLLQNAIQFTENNVITVSGKRIEHGAEFVVKDNGIGMTDEQKKYIFERFYKADPSRTKNGKSESGLGLSIVLSLVKQHGGEINVSSQLGSGSSFTLRLYDQGYEHQMSK